MDAHAADALVDTAHLELIEAFLEELHVAATVADLGVEARADGVVVCLGPHIVGSGHEDALLFDLALDVEDGLIFVHGGGGGRDAFAQDVEVLRNPRGDWCVRLRGATAAAMCLLALLDSSREGNKAFLRQRVVVVVMVVVVA